MKVPQIKSGSFEEFNKLPQTERFKYRAKGAVIDAINTNRIDLHHPIQLKPKDGHTYWGTLMASLERIFKGITHK